MTLTCVTLSGAGAGNYTVSQPSGLTANITYGTSCGANPGDVILQPINADGTSVFPHAGRTVPVKFTVCDANGNPISDPMVVFGNSTGSIEWINTVRGTVTQVDENGVYHIPDVAFRYTGGIWIFNMVTSNLQSPSTNTYRINLRSGSITFVIGIK